MATYQFVYGVDCTVTASTEQEAMSKAAALMNEETCPCGKTDCDCIAEHNIGVWLLPGMTPSAQMATERASNV